jgi:hypothetical protein
MKSSHERGTWRQESTKAPRAPRIPPRVTAAAVAALLAAALLAAVSVASAAPRPAPNNLRIIPGVGSLSASWGVTSTSGLAGFKVRWRPKAAPKRPWSQPIELSASARSYAIAGLRFATYEVRVRALFGAARRNGSGGKPSKKLGGSTEADATPLSNGEVEPPPEEEQPVEEPEEEEQEEEGPVEEEPTSDCTLYGSPAGRDSNSGAPGAPLRTVDGLLAKLNGGQTGCLAPGNYPGFSIARGDSHGRQGAPVTITSTDPEAPATISGRVTTMPGADWLTFSHLILTDSEVKYPSVSVGSAHTSWLWNDVSAPNTICFEPTAPGAYGPAEDTLIEHDRIHNCGQPFKCDTDSAPCNKPPNDGYFIHGVYDLGLRTTIRNSYIYANSSKGVLLRGGGGAVVEHNIIDGNGSGVIFGDLNPENDTFAWNIVTNSGGICGACFEYYGIWSYGNVGAGNVARNNDVFGNLSGNIGPHPGVSLKANVELDPMYVNAAKHDYTLKPGSPVRGYGPEEE